MNVGTIEDSKTTNYDKYTSNHPYVVERIGRFFGDLARLIALVEPMSILSLGCGEGFDLKSICEKSPGSPYCCGLDLNPGALRVAQELVRNFQFDSIQGDIHHLPFRLDRFDTVLCLEVLEHLEHPEAVMREISQRYNGYCVFSVPNEPLYRLTRMLLFRLNVRQFGNHPDHINHWSKRSFAQLVGQYFVIDQVTTPFPWTMVLCHSRGAAG